MKMPQVPVTVQLIQPVDERTLRKIRSGNFDEQTRPWTKRLRRLLKEFRRFLQMLEDMIREDVVVGPFFNGPFPNGASLNVQTEMFATVFHELRAGFDPLNLGVLVFEVVE